MKRILGSLFCILMAAAMFSACDAGPNSIFSMLEQETALAGGTKILNSNTVTFILRFNGYYYAAVGSNLMRRAVAAGSPWSKVTVDPTKTPPVTSGEINVISSGATDGTYLYISYAPVADWILRFDGTTWTNFNTFVTPPARPVQSLLCASDGQLFAAIQNPTTGTSSSPITNYSIYYDNAGTFTESSLDGSTGGVASGCPASIAYDGSNYWISAGSTIYTGSESNLATNAPSNDLILGVYWDATNSVLIAAGEDQLYGYTGSWTGSDTFDTSAQLSSVVIVPRSATNYAVLAGAVATEATSSTNTGYYEYDSALNGTFGSVTPTGTHAYITTETNYVTTLGSTGVEGFYYDSLGDGGKTVLFARSSGGTLWSNSWDTVSHTWSGWGRE